MHERSLPKEESRPVRLNDATVGISVHLIRAAIDFLNQTSADSAHQPIILHSPYAPLSHLFICLTLHPAQSIQDTFPIMSPLFSHCNQLMTA